MGLGSNGSLIDDAVAKKLKEAGIATVSISLDSNIPAQHDEFRGVAGAWEKAVKACKVFKKKQCPCSSQHHLNPAKLQPNR